MLKKTIPYTLLTLCLVGMLYFGVKAYRYALSYEAHTTELVTHQGVQEQAKRQKSIRYGFFQHGLLHFKIK